MRTITDYITADTAMPQFFPYPCFLLKMDLSYTARLLYALLLDRTTLSQKNGWQDSEGRTYIFYPVSEIAETLDKGRTAIKSALNELDAAGLLVRERRGFSAPNRLYVKVPQIPLVQFSDHMAAIQPEKRPISGEAESIGNAMRMRGITGKKLFKNPQAVLEYRIVPFMMSVVTIGKDLSAVALTRGLGNGIKRTSICKIGFHWKDFALMLVVTVALLVFLFFSGGLK